MNELLTSKVNSGTPELPDFIPNDLHPPITGPSTIFRPDPPIKLDPVIPPIFIPVKSLKCGCYLVNYTPAGLHPVWNTYDGTIRVECHSGGRTASGDLYQRPLKFKLPFGFLPVAGPKPVNGIPILGRKNYRYYLRVTKILEYFTFGNSFQLGFEMYRFDHTTSAWTNEGTVEALMTWQAAPAGYPSSADYLEGNVKNAAGATIGRLKMGWVSKYLRKATIEIDRVPSSESPLNSGTGEDWKSIFKKVDWSVKVINSNNNVAEPSGASWSDSEAHAAMLARRDSNNLDSEWRYHLLCVRLIDSTSRGIMYDAFGTDSNNVPREGAMIASHWVIPSADPWGLVKGVRFGLATAPYFRTAVHEIAHAMGQYHNSADNGILNTTNVIAATGTAANPFPNNILWQFSTREAKRLRHYPDIHVRPGGTPFGDASEFGPTISPTDQEITSLDGLHLEVSPLLETIPYGAPVRFNLKLSNSGDIALPVPADISLKGGFVHGYVLGPNGSVKTFKPIVICLDDEPIEPLSPKDDISYDATLLRGREGALFQTPGIHKVVFIMKWDIDDAQFRLESETHVMITSALDDDHAKAALKVLTSPDLLLTLAIGGDHLDEGIAALNVALDNPVLRPHFAYIEAKRMGERFGKRKPDYNKVSLLINEDTVMSESECVRAAQIAKQGMDGDKKACNAIAKAVKSKSKQYSKYEEIQSILA